MFQKNEHHELVFIYGKDSADLAAQAAASCSFFRIDDEDEMVSEIYQSCYNCRYRRWTVSSFVCKK